MSYRTTKAAHRSLRNMKGCLEGASLFFWFRYLPSLPNYDQSRPLSFRPKMRQKICPSMRRPLYPKSGPGESGARGRRPGLKLMKTSRLIDPACSNQSSIFSASAIAAPSRSSPASDRQTTGSRPAKCAEGKRSKQQIQNTVPNARPPDYGRRCRSAE